MFLTARREYHRPGTAAAGHYARPVGGRLVRGATTALVLMTCLTSAHAQSPSRADVQLGAAFLDVLPGLAMGGTGWITERAGLSMRVYFLPGHDVFDFANPPGVETTFRYRGFVGDVEVDSGIGLMTLRAEESRGSVVEAGEPTGRSSGRQTYVTTDVLLGRRLAKRFGLKVGVGFVLNAHELGFVTKLMVVVPLGGQ